jgi:hypothetical protein
MTMLKRLAASKVQTVKEEVLFPGTDVIKLLRAVICELLK